jgi:lipopolysaccharide transport system ATP-binding protein
MSNDVVIRIENLSKQYRLGLVGTGTLSHDINRWWHRVHGKEDPYQKVTEVNDRTKAAKGSSLASSRSALTAEPSSDYVWALKDINLEVKQGEVLGIIGRNGAGKSTLLKILSRITAPTTGEVKIKGRTASLLEVGTGFHKELTGRENIYLNGAIMGMTKEEVKGKLDEIVDFSSCERYIDTPVKRYSSGMIVRLGFAVAAHLEPDILIVDEVLAVGDIEFQKKCLGKMRSVTGEGRTILFVSHNMAAVRNLCPRTLMMDCGMLVLDTDTERAVAAYLDQNLAEGAVVSCDDFEGKVEGVINRDNPSIRLKEISLIDQQGLPRNEFQSNEEIRVSVTYECLRVGRDLRVSVYIVDEENTPILVSSNVDAINGLEFFQREPGKYRSICVLPTNLFGEKRFYLTVHLICPPEEDLVLNKILSFDVKFRGYNNVQRWSHKNVWIRPRLSWSTRFLSGSQVPFDG